MSLGTAFRIDLPTGVVRARVCLRPIDADAIRSNVQPWSNMLLCRSDALSKVADWVEPDEGR